jgi:hypothetical protein
VTPGAAVVAPATNESGAAGGTPKISGGRRLTVNESGAAGGLPVP